MTKKSGSIFSSSLKRAPYLFLIPFFAFFLLIRVGPILWSLVFSLMKYNGLSPPVFVGLQNYSDLLYNPRFWNALQNTLVFVLVYNVLMLSSAIILAVTVSSKFITQKRFYRTIFFLPIAMSLALVALVFDRVLARNYGLMNIVLKRLGHPGDIGWLDDPRMIMISIIIMRLWRGTGYYSAFLVAGLMSIPRSLYESSQLDGAGPVRTFFQITIPLLYPVILFCLIMSTILSFQLFDEPWIIHAGGPADAALTLQIFLYQTAFSFGELGRGSAVSYLMTLIMIGFSIFYSRSSEGKVI